MNYPMWNYLSIFYNYESILQFSYIFLPFMGLDAEVVRVNPRHKCYRRISITLNYNMHTDK